MLPILSLPVLRAQQVRQDAAPPSDGRMPGVGGVQPPDHDEGSRDPGMAVVDREPTHFVAARGGCGRSRQKGGAMLMSLVLPLSLAVVAATGFGCEGSPNLTAGDVPEDWWPAVDDVARGGWRDATTPWTPGGRVTDCRAPGSSSVDILPVDSGVYVAYTWTEVTGAPGSYDVDHVHSVVEFHDGAAWSVIYSADCLQGREPTEPPGTCIRRLCGTLTDGTVVRTWGASDEALGVLRSGTLELWPREWWEFSDPFTLGPDDALAVWTGVDSKVVRFEGGVWLPVVSVLPYDLPYRLIWQTWSDGDAVWIAGERGSVVSLEPAGWRVHALPTASDVTAVWGGGRSDAWVATDDGSLLRWDGSTWTAVEWPDLGLGSGDPCSESNAILGMWGTGPDLFIHTAHELAHWDGENFRVLGYWPSHAVPAASCEGGIRIVRVRGLSPTEVFVAAIGGEPGDRVGDGGLGGGASPSCFSRPFVVVWDGAVFHWI